MTRVNGQFELLVIIDTTLLAKTHTVSNDAHQSAETQSAHLCRCHVAIEPLLDNHLLQIPQNAIVNVGWQLESMGLCCNKRIYIYICLAHPSAQFPKGVYLPKIPFAEGWLTRDTLST